LALSTSGWSNGLMPSRRPAAAVATSQSSIWAPSAPLTCTSDRGGSPSGLCVDGWIPVDARTLETSAPDVYAVGDVTSVGTPKAGVFAEGQAGVVADAIIARQRGQPARDYDGAGVCYLEVGDDLVAKVQAVFRAGETPYGLFDPPSVALTEEKGAFGSDRIKRWFGRDWLATAG